MADFRQQGICCYASGHLNQTDVISLWAHRHSLMDSGTQVLNLSQIEYCDSAGVAFLLDLASHVKAEGMNLQMVSPSAQLQKFIVLYDLNDFFIEEAKQGE